MGEHTFAHLVGKCTFIHLMVKGIFAHIKRCRTEHEKWPKRWFKNKDQDISI